MNGGEECAWLPHVRSSRTVFQQDSQASASRTLGLGLLFPKYYLIFYSKFPKLLLYYSLKVDPLFHEILLTVSQK